MFLCFHNCLFYVLFCSAVLSQVVVGEEADITSAELNTLDVDTPAEELIYSVEALTNGMVALKISPEESIYNFTQAQVDNDEIVFIHQGIAYPTHLPRLV